MTEHYFLYNGNTVHYKKFGKNFPVIVLLHGFAEDGNVWKYQVEFLQKYFSILVPDLPGSGKSEMIKEAVSMDDFAEIIFQLLRSENINNCIMAGHSMGGYIALSFAKKYPVMLKAFALVHSTAFADSVEKKEARKKGIALMEQYGSYSFIKSTTPNLFSAFFKKNNAHEIEALIEKGKEFKVEALQQYYRAMMNREDRSNILISARFPVFFVTGKNDAAIMLNDSLKQMHLPSVSYIHILENAGHMGFWEEFENVNHAILNFVNDMKEG